MVENIKQSLAFAIIVEEVDAFTDFLNAQINERNWSISELARRADVSQSLASDVVNGKLAPSERFCIRAARALSLPGDSLLRLAGHLPSLLPAVEEEQAILYEIRKLPECGRRILLRFLRGLVEEATPHQLPPKPATREEREEVVYNPGEPLGERALDPDEITVYELDTLVRLATPDELDTLALYYETLATIKRRAEKNERADQTVLPGGAGNEEASGIPENPRRNAIPIEG
jgi:transcriptional regulator with XRE-family HTH domain